LSCISLMKKFFNHPAQWSIDDQNFAGLLYQKRHNERLRRAKGKTVNRRSRRAICSDEYQWNFRPEVTTGCSSRMVKCRFRFLPHLLIRRDRKTSSPANVFSSNPPVSKKAWAKQNMKLPAASFLVLESKFQNLTSFSARKGSSESKLSSVPPPQLVPLSRRVMACFNNGGGRSVSASKNTRKALFAALAPVLRALDIWRKGSKTILVPFFLAISAVLSVESLSTIIISPCCWISAIADFRLTRVSCRNDSSL